MNRPHPTRRPPPSRSRLPRVVALGLFAALLAGCATQPPPGQAPKLHEVRYLCADGVVLEVSYLNLPGGESYVSLPFQGHTAVLQSRPAASGVRYVDQDEQQGLRWTTRGGEGFLSILPADHTASEKPLLNNCRATPAR